MMAETAIEKEVCKKCGVEVREGSLFCYNCGGSVTEVAPAPETPSLPQARPPLRSAASLRQQRRAINRRVVEVSWEPPPDGTPRAFVVSTIVLTIAAIGLLLIALYLR